MFSGFVGNYPIVSETFTIQIESLFRESACLVKVFFI